MLWPLTTMLNRLKLGQKLVNFADEIKEQEDTEEEWTEDASQESEQDGEKEDEEESDDSDCVLV